MNPSPWKCALELRPDRTIAAGSQAALCDAVRRGADLRVYTEWRYEEHVAPFAPGESDPRYNGLFQENIDFRETVLVDDRHVAGITTLRQPILPCDTGFNGVTPKMSFFLYNMDALQCCAQVFLDGTVPKVQPGTRTNVPSPADASKMSSTEVFDEGTCAPSRNFIYDMEVYRFWVKDDWEPVLAHDEQGNAVSGSWDAFHQAHVAGREFKVGVRDLSADLGPGPSHEVFTLLGSGWIHTGQRYYEALSHPLVRVAPGIPLKYRSRNWDVAWVFLRTKGAANLRTLDPYTRTFRDTAKQFASRWFVR